MHNILYTNQHITNLSGSAYLLGMSVDEYTIKNKVIGHIEANIITSMGVLAEITFGKSIIS